MLKKYTFHGEHYFSRLKKLNVVCQRGAKRAAVMARDSSFMSHMQLRKLSDGRDNTDRVNCRKNEAAKIHDTLIINAKVTAQISF